MKEERKEKREKRKKELKKKKENKKKINSIRNQKCHLLVKERKEV